MRFVPSVYVDRARRVRGSSDSRSGGGLLVDLRLCETLHRLRADDRPVTEPPVIDSQEHEEHPAGNRAPTVVAHNCERQSGDHQAHDRADHDNASLRVARVAEQALSLGSAGTNRGEVGLARQPLSPAATGTCPVDQSPRGRAAFWRLLTQC